MSQDPFPTGAAIMSDGEDLVSIAAERAAKMGLDPKSGAMSILLAALAEATLDALGNDSELCMQLGGQMAVRLFSATYDHAKQRRLALLAVQANRRARGL